MKRKFYFFLIISTIILGIIGYSYYQKNIYSKDILKLEILGIETAVMGQEVEYTVKYKNNGDIRLEDPELIFEYPSHSLLEDEDGDSLRKILDIGDAIYPGEEKTISFKARLFGKESELLEAKAFLSYRPKNLKAFYESSTTFTTIIEKVPLSFDLDLPLKMESAKNVKFRINYFSNSDYPLSGLGIRIKYPSGFEFISSNPDGMEKNEWEVLENPLNKANGGRIEIEGMLMGEIGEEKIFEAKLGIWRQSEFVVLKEDIKGVELIRPSLYISQQINGNPMYVASPGDFLHYEIFFKNIGEDDFNDLFLIVKLEGEAFDLLSLKADKGDFGLGDNSIIFDWRKNSNLQLLSSQEEGKIEFWVKLKENWGEKESQKITSKIVFNQIWREFETKVNSKLEVVQKGYFEDEIFGNSGSIPPKVGEPTTYTITWQAKNYHNDVENVRVRAILPKNVILTGKIFPEEGKESFSFDSKSKEIVWNIGEIKAGESVPNISFQIEFTPDSSQKGRIPQIVGLSTIKGEDKWTDQIIEAETPFIDTSLPDDESIKEEDGIVQ